MIKILICDDHRLVIDGLQLMLSEASDMVCEAVAFDGTEALAKLAQFPVDVLILDINMPGMDGVECCKIVHERFPSVKILVLSMMSEVSLVKAMMKNGASGYLLKNAGKDEVLESVRMVHEGKQAFSASLLESLLNASIPKANKSRSHSFPSISRREKQILQLIVDEKTTSEIAADLFISFGTVETHRRSLLMKLSARNTAGLVRAALEFNLLD